MNILDICNASKQYTSTGQIKTQALNAVNITVGQGEFVGIMGPSGSGKTTLLNIAAGIDRCDAGQICIMGKDIAQIPRDELAAFRRKHIGMVFQDFNLLPSLSIKENILVPLILDDILDAAGTDKVDALAQMLDIDDVLEKYPYEISGGQQQRAAICRAIVAEPKIIFADEPTGNLDSKSSQSVLGYFDKILAECGVSIVMVTHDPFSASHCSRIIFLKDGKTAGELLREGDRDTFFHQILSELHRLQQG